jgi:hypothetical protein
VYAIGKHLYAAGKQFCATREVFLSHRKAQLWHGLSTALASAGQSVSTFKPLFIPSARFGKKR